MKTAIRSGEMTVDPSVIKSELMLGFRDQKQVRKLRKDAEKAATAPRKMSLLQRMKSWRNSGKRVSARTSVESPLIDSKGVSDNSDSSSDEEKSKTLTPQPSNPDRLL